MLVQAIQPAEPHSLSPRERAGGRGNEFITLTVKDSGIGMSQQDLEKIWERFYRGTASKQFAKGSGLGLSIVKELVELHGGDITVESEEGKGTTFKLSLPMERNKNE